MEVSFIPDRLSLLAPRDYLAVRNATEHEA
jgi:hypothetical protein